MKKIVALMLVGMIVGLTGSGMQVRERSDHDQVVRLIERVNQIEEHLQDLQSDGTGLSRQSASQILLLEAEVTRLGTLVYGVMGFVFVQLAGLAWWGVRYYLRAEVSEDRRERDEHR